MAFRLCFVTGMLGLLLTLASGCEPCCAVAASATQPGADGVTAPADGEGKANAEPAQTDKGDKTEEVKVAVTGMT